MKTEPSTDDTTKEARRISVRMELASGMLAHAHTIDIDHLQELSMFVLSGKRRKPKIETQP